MLGRKAILHNSNKGKRKWQLEQEKADLSDSSESEPGSPEEEEKRCETEQPAVPSVDGPRRFALDNDADGARDGSDADLSDAEGRPGKEARREPRPKARRQVLPAGAEEAPHEAQQEAQAQTRQEPSGELHEPDEEEGDEDVGGQKRKRFAWMDSEDEVSEGEDEEAAAKAGNAAREAATDPGSADTTAAVDPAPAAPAGGAAAAEAAPFPPLPPANPLPTANLGGLAGALPQLPPVRVTAGGLETPLLQSMRPGMLRPSMRPPPVLPPGAQLPELTQEHLGLMAQISVTRNMDEMWDLLDKHAEGFAAAHASTSLYRLTLLNSTTTGASLDQKLEKNSSFIKLSNRVDELLATAEGRATFLPADLAMVASALAKVVQLPAKEGALGRIFADIADEVEARIAVEPAAFTPPMLGDIAWGVSKSETVNGLAKACVGKLQKAVVSPAMRRFFGAVIEASMPRLAEMTCQDLANLAFAFADATREDADGLLRGIFEQAQQRLAYHPPPTNALFSASVVPGQPASAAPPQQPAATPPPKPVVVPPPPPAVVPAAGSGPVQPPAPGAAAAAAPAPAAAGAAAEGAEAGDNGSAVSADGMAPQAAPAAPAKEKPPHWQQSGQWKFTGAQISEIASAVSKHINLYEPDFFDLVAKQFLQRLQEFTTDQLRKLRDAFDTVRHDRDFEFLRTMKMVLKTREVRRTCKAYRLGNCKFGDRCVYSHDD